MSSTSDQDSWNKYLQDSLGADQQQTSEYEQNEAINAQIDSALEQAKSSALEAGTNLIGMGGIEIIRATSGLYTTTKGLYTRVQQMKDIATKIKAQSAAKTAKIETLKEQKYNEASAKNAEIDELTGQARGPVIDKAQFMSDADTAIAKAGRTATINKIRGALAEKAAPYIDAATGRINEGLDIVGAKIDTASNYVKNGFAHFTDTANNLKSAYLEKFSNVKNLSGEALGNAVKVGQDKLANLKTVATSQGIEGIDEHTGVIGDLLQQGTRQSVAQASVLYDNLKTNLKSVVPFQKIQNAKASIEDVKASAETQKADVMNGLEETKADLVNKIQLKQRQLQIAEGLGPGAKEFNTMSKEDVIQSIKSDIDTHNLDLDKAVGDASNRVGAISDEALAKVNDLTGQIATHSDAILASANDVSKDLLSRVTDGLGRARTAVSDGLSAARTAIAPVADVVGALVTPVAVWQGALSAENLVKGNDAGNLQAGAMDAINVRFGVGAAKQGVQQIGGQLKSLIGGTEQATATATTEAETAVAKIPAENAVIEGTAKSVGTSAGEEIAGGLAEGGGEELAEVGIGEAVGAAIPVVGEVLDVGLALFSLGEGFKSLFDSPTKPAPAPTQITQSVSFEGQAGVY